LNARAWLAAITASAGALACAGAPALASPPRPADLRVVGEADVWRSDNHFQLVWTIPSSGAGPSLAAAHYRVRNPDGATIEEEEVAWTSNGVSVLTRPKVGGIYAAEVWLEDSAGDLGPAAVAQLRFDDVQPAAIEPLPVAEWLGRAAFPLRIRLTHPAGPLPLSGIRGYAIAVDAEPGGAPCAASDRCSDAETTLRGGAGEDELEIAALAEGTSYLHAVAVSGTGMKSAASGRAVLRVDTADPVTQLAGAPAGWTNRTAWLSASATDSASGMEPRSGGPPPFTAIRVDDGAPEVALGAAVATSVVGEGAHRIAYYARDAAGNVDDGTRSNGIANRDPRTAWVRIDRTPPRAGFANSQDPRDPDQLRVRIADPLSGPDPARGWIGVRPAGSGDRFEALPAAAAGEAELRARWRSDDYAEGEYEFRAIAYDAAGNSTATSLRQNGTPMVLSNPLKAVTALRAGFGGRVLSRQRCARRHGHRRCRRETIADFGRGPAARTVPYGRGIVIGGRLTTGRSSPLGGMAVRIVERFAAGARPATRVSTLRTEPGGAFSIRLAPGPSREIATSFDGSPTLARAAGNTLELRVRSRVRLRASAGVARVGGAPVVFGGRVLASAGAIPAAGKSVQLQFRLPGLPWAEFRTIQTDRRGRFRYAYRFSDDDSRGARFQFRAYAPAQAGWPYEPGGSRPLIVRGI